MCTPERLIWCCLTIILGINFYFYLNIAILAFVVTVRYTFHEFIAFKIFLLIIFSCYDQVCGLSITSPFSLFLPGNTRIGDLLDNYACLFSLHRNTLTKAPILFQLILGKN